MTRRLTHLLAVAACAAVTVSCAIREDPAPRDIAEKDRPDLVAGNAAAGGEGGTARVYLLVPDDGAGRRLQAVRRNVLETPQDLIASLLQGPTSDELSEQVRTALPSGLTLLSSRTDSGTLTLDFSEELRELTGDSLINAIAQIVWTTSQIEGIEAFRVLVEGQAEQWPSLSGELQADLLTVFDYQGIVRSSQPAFPTVPSPVQG
jgi:spore germination protein GerM